MKGCKMIIKVALGLISLVHGKLIKIYYLYII